MAITLVTSFHTITIKEIMLIISQVDYSSKWFFFRYVSFSEVLYMKTIKKIFKTQVKTVSIISWDITFNCMELEKPWLHGHFTRWDFLSRYTCEVFKYNILTSWISIVPNMIWHALQFFFQNINSNIILSSIYSKCKTLP